MMWQIFIGAREKRGRQAAQRATDVSQVGEDDINIVISHRKLVQKVE